jgi:hypothetical protein
LSNDAAKNAIETHASYCLDLQLIKLFRPRTRRRSQNRRDGAIGIERLRKNNVEIG